MRASLATLVDEFRRHGRQIAIVTYRGNRRSATTYAELAELASGFAAELARRQIAPGERVILWGQNSASWVAAFFGCVLRGVLAVPLDAAGAVDFGERIVAETQPRLLVGDPALLDALNSPIPSVAFDQIAALGPARDLDPVPLTPDTPLQILFTSGTTGIPKGVVHTHRNVLASLDPIEREMQKYLRYERIFHPLRFLHTLPLSHVFGQFMGLWIPPLLAAEVHYDSRLEPARIIETIRRERISVLAAVPRALELLRGRLLSDDPGLSCSIAGAYRLSIGKRWWRFRRIHRQFGLKFWAFVCGGASLPSALETFWSTLGFALIQGYGMTETAALVTLNHPFKIGKGTIGKPLPGREIRIAENGEMFVQGEMVANANWQNGAMVKRVDPWLATGDIVSQDDAGQLHFLGRKSEVIVTSAGLNIHPEDLEAALNRQRGIAACAVVAIETAQGPQPAAAIIAPAGAEAAEQAVLAANRELADFQRIRNWRVWPQPDLPRTSTGKVQRRKIAAWFQAQDAIASGKSEDSLVLLVQSITGRAGQRSDDDARLDEDMGMDSLARVQLQSALEERFAVFLSDESMSHIQTLGQLRAILENTASSASHPSEEQRAGHAQTEPAPAIAPHVPYPEWPWSWPVRWMRIAFLECIGFPLVKFLAAPRIDRTKLHNIPHQPLLIIANHITAFDAPLVLYALPRRVRDRAAIAMSGEILDDFRHARNQGSWWRNLLGPVQYWLVTALFNVFPLPRLGGFRQSFAHAGRALDRGYSVLVFPEGRRSADGRLQPFRSGIGILATESRAPVLPVALKGLGELKATRARWFRSSRITVVPSDPVRIGAESNPEQVTARLQGLIASLLS